MLSLRVKVSPRGHGAQRHWRVRLQEVPGETFVAPEAQGPQEDYSTLASMRRQLTERTVRGWNGFHTCRQSELLGPCFKTGSYFTCKPGLSQPR